MRDRRFTVGGVLDLAALSALAGQHRPTDQTALAAETARLIGDGLSIEDAAIVLRLTPAAVADLLTTVDQP